LTEDELDQVNNLAINWDLPPVNENNRKWLAQSILFHAVSAIDDILHGLLLTY